MPGISYMLRSLASSATCFKLLVRRWLYSCLSAATDLGPGNLRETMKERKYRIDADMLIKRQFLINEKTRKNRI